MSIASAVLLFISNSALADCNCLNSSQSISSQISNICEVYTREPHFAQICQTVPKELRLECSGGELTALDEYNLRGSFSGMVKGAWASAKSISSMVWNGFSSLAKGMWSTYFKDQVTSSMQTISLVRSVIKGEPLSLEDVQKMSSKGSEEESSPTSPALKESIDQLSKLKPSDLQKVKDWAGELLMNSYLGYSCMRPEAQEELITSLIVELTFPPAALIEFIAAAKVAKNVVELTSGLRKYSGAIMSGVAKTTARFKNAEKLEHVPSEIAVAEKLLPTRIGNGVEVTDKLSSISLTQPDIRALREYVYMDFFHVNRYLRSLGTYGPTMKGNLEKKAVVLRSVLNKTSNFRGTVFRGDVLKKATLEKYMKGQVFTEAGFLSTSKELEIAKKFNETRAGEYGEFNVLFTIDSTTGKDISKYVQGHENEVLFRSGTQFRVLSTSWNGKKYEIHLSEVP